MPDAPPDAPTDAPPRATTALITGASCGIGRELARCLAAAGHPLVITARDEHRLTMLATELAREHGVPVHVIPADLADPHGPHQLVQAIHARQIAIDILVNNAGFGTHGPFATLPLERELALIQVNISAVVALTRLLLPAMLARRRGRILNVASVAAFQPGPLMADYYASKAFVLSFSEAIAAELDRTGVHVTALCPGPTETEFAARAGLSGSSKLRRFAGLSAAEVARIGYRGMMNGRSVVVTGWGNRLLAAGVRFAPKRLVLGAVRRLNENR